MEPKTKVEELSPCERKLTVEIPSSVIDFEIQNYYDSLVTQVNLKGFRPGKAPIQVIKTQYKGQVIKDVISQLIEKTYAQALKVHDLFAVDHPKIDSSGTYEEGKSFTFTAVVEIKPQVQVKDYFGIAIEKEKIEIEPKRVNDTLVQLQESRSKLKAIDASRGVQGKDFVVIDFDGLMDGKTFPGGSAQNFLYEMGSQRFIPGFEEGLLHMKLQDTKELRLNFPPEFHEKKLAGKPVMFKVCLKEIKEKEVPEMNDELAKEFEGCQTLEDLKSKVLRDLTQTEESRIKREMESELLRKLVDKNKFSPPPSMVTRQHVFLLDDAKERLKKMGLQKENMEDQIKQWESNLQEKAMFDVQVILLLEAIAKKEKLDINETELDQGLEKIAKSAGSTVEKVKAYYRDKGTLPQIRWQMLQDKTIDQLLSKAMVSPKKKSK